MELQQSSVFSTYKTQWDLLPNTFRPLSNTYSVFIVFPIVFSHFFHPKYILIMLPSAFNGLNLCNFGNNFDAELWRGCKFRLLQRHTLSCKQGATKIKQHCELAIKRLFKIFTIHRHSYYNICSKREIIIVLLHSFLFIYWLVLETNSFYLPAVVL